MFTHMNTHTFTILSFHIHASSTAAITAPGLLFIYFLYSLKPSSSPENSHLRRHSRSSSTAPSLKSRKLRRCLLTCNKTEVFPFPPPPFPPPSFFLWVNKQSCKTKSPTHHNKKPHTVSKKRHKISKLGLVICVIFFVFFKKSSEKKEKEGVKRDDCKLATAVGLGLL